MHRKTSRRSTGILVVTAIVMGILGIGVGPAWSDEAQPQNVAPTITSVTPSGDPTPSQGGSGVVSVAVALGDANSLDDLNTVVVIAYRTSTGDSTGASPDARNTAKFTYTVGGSVSGATGFSLLPGGSTWALGTAGDASTGLSDGAATSGTVTFKFRLGEVAAQGTWSLRSVVTDMTGATATQTDADALTVGWYAEFTSAGAKNFGTLAMGGSATVSSGHSVQSNGASKLLYSTSATWSNGTQTIALVASAPGSRQFSYLLNGGTVMGTDPGTDSSYLGTSAAAPIGLTSITSSGTAEGGATVNDVAKFSMGTAVPAGSSFSGTVTVAIAAA